MFRRILANSSHTRIALYSILRICQPSLKNEQVQKVFWTFFVAFAGLVLAQVVDPAAAAEIVETIAGIVP